MCADVTEMGLLLHNPASVKWTNAIAFMCVVKLGLVAIFSCGTEITSGS